MENKPETILQVKHLKQFFKFDKGEMKYNKAIHDISFDIYQGEVFGLVGESGCGKTTTGRSIIKLYDITSGDIFFKGVRIATGTRFHEKEIKYTLLRARQQIVELKKNFRMGQLSMTKNQLKEAIAHINYQTKKIVAQEKRTMREARYEADNCNAIYAKQQVEAVKHEYAQRAGANYQSDVSYKKDLKLAKSSRLMNKMQMIFQDPIACLNPRMTVREIIAEGYHIRGIKDKTFIEQKVNEVLKLVGLVPEHASRYPHEFSGGQRQRIGIARAIIMEPEFIIADEPVSALDVSIQAQVINLLNELKKSLGLTILFIAHDLSVVKYFCDRIAVMYFGKIVELASSDELFKHPLHPYTKSLLSAIPRPDPVIEKKRVRLNYNPHLSHDYTHQEPAMQEVVAGHWVYCDDKELKNYQDMLQGDRRHEEKK